MTQTGFSYGFPDNGRKATGAVRLLQVKADIETHLARHDLGALWLSKRQGITQRHLRRLFEGEGWTLSHYVTQRRLEWAHRLLSDRSNAGTSITAVAFDTGFRDLSYFNRCFQKHFGVRPRDIRDRGLSSRLGDA